MAKKPKPDKAATPERPLDISARAYWLTRAQKFAEQGQAERLTETLDRLWPDARDPDRLAWLAANAPDALATALAQGNGPIPEPCLMALVASVLEWPASAAEALLGVPSLPAGFAADARAVRDASAKLAAGDDTAAAAALKRIGRESRFRDPQRFLRGLSAFYQGDAEAAQLALGALLGGTYGTPAAALLQALGVHEGAPPALVAMLPISDAGRVAPLVAALQAKRPNQAISALAAALPTVSRGLQTALVRDFPGALLALGVPDESIVGRLKKAVPALGTWVDPGLLDGLICEARGLRDDAIDGLLAVSNGWIGKLPSRAIDQALVLQRAARLVLEDVDRESRSSGRCPDCGEYHGWDPGDGRDAASEARDYLEDAVALAPTDETLWSDLVRAAEALGDRKVRDKVLGRFVERFPEHPTALVATAEACLERGAFDKGMGLAASAMEILPLDRGPRALLSRLLIGKARKKFGDDRVSEAQALLERAVQIPMLDAEMRQRATAAAAVVRFAGGVEADFDTLRREATQDDPRPWLWTFRFTHEWLRFQSAPKKKSAPPLPKATLMPCATPLGDAELKTLLQAYRDATNEDIAHRTLLGPCVLRAVESAPKAVSSAGDVRLLLSLRPQPELAYAVLLRAMHFAPNEFDFIIARWELAVELNHPVKEFVGAEFQLTEMLDGEELRDWGPMMAARVRATLERVRSYLAKPASAPGARRTGRTAPKNAAPKNAAPKNADKAPTSPTAQLDLFPRE